MKQYQPKPVDTADITLSPELGSLVESMAENVHEMWAQTRIEQGWQYGPKRDDDQKLHPCLIPYDQLPEDEKVYDRNSAVETLKLIQKLGFEIRRVNLREQYRGQPLSLRKIQSLAAEHPQMSESDRHWLAKSALSLGENFIAYDLAETLTLQQNKLHIQGLALARSGALKRASEFAAKLKDFDDPECAGFRSRIYKDLAVAAVDPAEKAAHFIHAAQISLRAFEANPNYYNGVNAASCFLLGGQADQVPAIVGKTVALASKAQDLWAVATLGECALLLNDREKAKQYYRQASQLARGRNGDLASAVRQLKLLLAKLDGNADALGQYVELPSIALFAGRPGCPPDGFEEARLRQDLTCWLQRQSLALAYLNCAGPQEVVFAETLLAAQVECFVVFNLPRQTSMQKYFSGCPGWAERAAAVLDHPLTTVIAAESQETGEGDEIISEFSGRYLLGLAKLRSKNLSFPLSGVYAGKDGAPPLWKKQGIDVTLLRGEK